MNKNKLVLVHPAQNQCYAPPLFLRSFVIIFRVFELKNNDFHEKREQRYVGSKCSFFTCQNILAYSVQI